MTLKYWTNLGKMKEKIKTTRLAFEQYLEEILAPTEDPKKYSKNLDNKIKKFYLEKLSRKLESLYTITDINEVRDIKNDIVANPNHVYSRKKAGDDRIKGLDNYISFLEKGTLTPKVETQKKIRRSTEDEEGKHVTKETTVIQRNQSARKKCIEHYGCKCAACGIVMKDIYGEIGENFIEVHHLNPIHLFDDQHVVDYKEDLIPLCPNCHAMIHKLEDPGDINTLQKIINCQENNAK